MENKNGESDKPHWSSRNDFDEGIRDALRLGSSSGRDAANTGSDVLMGIMIAAPVVDSFATLGMRDGRWDAVWQTEMINLESFTFTSLASSLLQNLVARERPLARDCGREACGGDEINRSMPSGHVAFAFTGAGLLCTHHAYHSLYADPGAERALCATGLAAATAEGFLRVMSDRHYATDVLAGTGIGLFSGFLLPRLLHYYWPQQPAQQSERDRQAFFKEMAVTPQIYGDGGGLSFTATY
ncbi:phosphatase PAP2 family protein [Geomonas sp.]|uniref:phosphatase PAP2 family protein n=1 Tax=Geomonas sp. TaxID=2651584 RepID=UPI002B45EFF9|nr:phosphatase PAP2 family protein [Geomonas sp.]HJV36392.1 phosphatase PAP2 family protein [Geomonas sp.]